LNAVYRRIPRLPQATIAAYAEIDVAAVHESMQHESLMDHQITSVVLGKRVSGQAITALNSPGDILAMHAALAIAQPGDILVITSASRSVNAVWGEMATTYAKSVGLAGVVTDGAVRDSAFIRQAGFPVWTRLIHAQRSSRSHALAVNVPINCGGVRVYPGDVVIADDDGVVVVPFREAGAVLERARHRKAAEAARRPKLASGTSPYELGGLEQTLRNLETLVSDSEWTAEP
jgi:4-hydroxy-4-methyl-2-oxoglutarate aldolase